MNRNGRSSDEGEESDESAADRSSPPLHPRRRRVLRYCRTAPDASIAVEELATAIRIDEIDGTEATASDDRRRLVAIDLHHAHLPRLSAEGYIEYDPARAVVYPAGRRV